MADPRQMVEQLFEAFNRRDAAGIAALCDEGMEFFAVTGEEVGRDTPYMGPRGLHDYLADVARVWEELLITAREVKGGEERVLVRGRVYLRSRDLGIRDMPAAWIWEVRGGRFVRGEVFIDLELAETRFEQISA
jgi:ketosteroid isomerase-like protein